MSPVTLSTSAHRCIQMCLDGFSTMWILVKTACLRVRVDYIENWLMCGLSQNWWLQSNGLIFWLEAAPVKCTKYQWILHKTMPICFNFFLAFSYQYMTLTSIWISWQGVMCVIKLIYQTNRKFGTTCDYKQIISTQKREIIVLKEEMCSLQNTINTREPKLKIESERKKKPKYETSSIYQWKNWKLVES